MMRLNRKSNRKDKQASKQQAPPSQQEEKQVWSPPRPTERKQGASSPDSWSSRSCSPTPVSPDESLSRQLGFQWTVDDEGADNDTQGGLPMAPLLCGATSCAPWMCVFDLDAAEEKKEDDDDAAHGSLSLDDVWKLAMPSMVTTWLGDDDGDDHGKADNFHVGGKRRKRQRPRPRPFQRRPSVTLADFEGTNSVFYDYASDSNVEMIIRNEGDQRRPSGGNKGMAASASQASQASDDSKTHVRKKTPSNEMDAAQLQAPGTDRSALKELPVLRDAAPNKREELFVMKLKLCSVIFSFDDPTADKRGKDMKRQTLLELVDYVNTPSGQKIFTESIMGDLMAMVSANVCRALPPATDDFDPEEDEPVLEPAWPHLQVAYEFFLRFIVSSEVNAKAAKKYVDQKFCLQLVELFDSEDPRERDYLKTILHRIYGKFMSHRSFIRRAISNVFYRFVYETERHNGIGELLEILGSIINGFAIPLKKEHLQFLVRALIPLHKPKCVSLYHQQLSYCIIQYVEKDADTATPILNGFFKCWPWSNSGKQVMFLNELEEILELLGADQLAQVSNMLFTNLTRCLDSDHFQVVERALFLWNNEHLVNSGCLSRLNAHAVLPIIYGPLHKNSSGHWNATVEGLAQNVLKMYMEYDLQLYDKCSNAYQQEEEEAKKKLDAISDKWSAIEQLAVSKRPALLVS